MALVNSCQLGRKIPVSNKLKGIERNINERPDTWVTVCTGHIGDTSSPRGGSDALEGVFGYG